jgi:ribosomal protein S18 acetylase RimI-like enzyme
MRTVLRPAHPEDFDYCATLYFAGMESTIRGLNLDRSAQFASLRQRWSAPEVEIITLAGMDVGWLQTVATEDALFVAHLFVERAFQRQGIGTEVMTRLIAQAERASRAVTLGVVKTNPAFRLYQRLGFRVTHEDERKFYMRREL